MFLPDAVIKLGPVTQNKKQSIVLMNSSALSPVTPLSYVSDVSSHETLPSGLAMKPSRLETMCAVTLGVFVVIYLTLQLPEHGLAERAS
jgi:hypothetical protein